MDISVISFFTFIFFFSVVTSNPSDSSFTTTYHRLCNDIVPVSATSPPSDSPTSPAIADSLSLQSAYFSGGDPLFNRSPDSSFYKHVAFHVNSARRIPSDGTIDGLYELLGQMNLQQRARRVRSSPARVYHGPRVPLRMRVSSLKGYWSESSGKLCMFGRGFYSNTNNLRDVSVSVVIKLRYPNRVTLLDSLITGSVESFDEINSLHYFEPVSMLTISRSSNYYFTMGGNNIDSNGCVAGSGSNEEESLNLGNVKQGVCYGFLDHVDSFRVEYGSHCNNVSCNLFGGGSGVEKLLGFMGLYRTRCVEGGKIQMLLDFHESEYTDWFLLAHPNTTLISEGVWDENENRLCAVACRILNITGTPYVGDCSIKLTLRFPAVLSLRNRSTILGKIWSDKPVGESGYFGSVGFERISKRSVSLPGGLQYKYTEIGRVRKSCAEKMTARGKGKNYPDVYSSDTAFSMVVTNSEGQVTQGYSLPLFVGDQGYEGRPYGVPFLPTNGGNLKAHSLQFSNSLNVSYAFFLNPSSDFKFGNEISSTEMKISAEGLYNRKTGVMCLIGCRRLRTNDKLLTKNESLDCEIMINIQFPPLNAKGGQPVEGTIASMRQKTDSYYFEPLQLSSYSMSKREADASIWRMDLEIVMVMISNTLACVFVGLQLLHVKKHAEALPRISIVMLLFITLGHMIPLMLNFEALFKVNHNSVQDTFLGSGGWLQVKEVVVRMVTMVAFLLELRLLQLTWSSRQTEESQSQPGLWVSEKWVLFIILPLYFTGGLTAWFVHIWKNHRQKSSRPFRLSRHKFKTPRKHINQLPSLWEDMKSYAGLLLDGFLLPQILFNILSNSEEKPLASLFYFGTTIVRILPHAYDLYRAHSYAWHLGISYIYADHSRDFYSTAWDIGILIGALLFALVVYFQQRFGSRCFLPKRFRGTSAYEKVPVIGNDDL
ncbi:uncharacterized protein LOC131596450 [Vicia villosa]|uniref:uncharacterized protein LOC131596450 n=1 Tax=Vicia villosa TaxID=3911 RepID=UPI00273AE884|nr:uncharacterized protein LOC131596450 [Vicia villosa]